MSSAALVTFHASQFPENVRRDLLLSLRSRRVNHKFHYDSYRQTQKWLALHQAYSPSRNDASAAAAYDHGFQAAADRLTAKGVHVIGLGCGGGQKDTRLIQALQNRGREALYTPCDVSSAMVLVARQTALSVVAPERCFPLVCDLATAEDLPSHLDSNAPADAARLITFFGMMPNFEPEQILPRLTGLLRPADCLLLSANLAPGSDYLEGLRRILPQYDNPLTRDWLITFLLDLGVELGDGEMRFSIEDDSAGLGLKRVSAYFHFTKSRAVEIGSEGIEFAKGDAIRLFFSYRHTPARLRALADSFGLELLEQWIADSGEEGVFLARKRLGFQA